MATHHLVQQMGYHSSDRSKIQFLPSPYTPKRLSDKFRNLLGLIRKYRLPFSRSQSVATSDFPRPIPPHPRFCLTCRFWLHGKALVNRRKHLIESGKNHQFDESLHAVSRDRGRLNRLGNVFPEERLGQDLSG